MENFFRSELREILGELPDGATIAADYSPTEFPIIVNPGFGSLVDAVIHVRDHRYARSVTVKGRMPQSDARQFENLTALLEFIESDRFHLQGYSLHHSHVPILYNHEF